MNKNEAWGLPPGSIRAILAVLVVSATIVSVFLRGSVPETLATLSGTVVVFYFNKARG